MASRGFQFKQFFVAHDKCAMKVGTDGTLLGAMVTAPLPPVQAPSPHRLGRENMITPAETPRVLDVGTGSGLVALMLAQRYEEAEIDAIDIDEGAVEQARENFAASPWGERLHAHLSKLQDWNDNDARRANDNLYDIVVSNPPYFQNSLKNPDKGREMARHTDSLSYEELVVHSRRLLRKGGCLWLILPAEAEEEILRLAATHDFRAEKIVYIHPKPEKPAKRVVLQLSYDPRKALVRPSYDPSKDIEADCPEKMTFYIESAHSPRSEEYAELTKDFYL